MTNKEIRIAVAECLGLVKKLPKFKHRTGQMLSVCPKCEGRELDLWDCGYSSFNCGGVKCKCGHKIDLKSLSCFPEKEIAKSWNAHCKAETSDFPDWPSSLDACHEMEKTLTDDEGGEYEELLEDIAQRDLLREGSNHWLRFKVCHAKATQRCEAFLKLKGKWNE